MDYVILPSHASRGNHIWSIREREIYKKITKAWRITMKLGLILRRKKIGRDFFLEKNDGSSTSSLYNKKWGLIFFTQMLGSWYFCAEILWDKNFLRRVNPKIWNLNIKSKFYKVLFSQKSFCGDLKFQKWAKNPKTWKMNPYNMMRTHEYKSNR